MSINRHHFGLQVSHRLAARLVPYSALVVAGLVLLIWLSPLLFGGKALFWGTPGLQFVPWWSYAFQTVMDGHLPMWNPGVGMGAPLLANYQTALFYPPTWLLAIFYALGGSPWLAWGLTPLLGIHLLFSGWGISLLLKKLGSGVFGQSLSALAWVMCSYLTARVNFPSIVFSAAWLPWILLQLTPEHGKPSFTRGKFLRLAFSLALLLLSGHAQTTWYILLISAAWCAYWAVHTGHTVNSSHSKQFGRLQGIKCLAKSWLWFGAAILLAAGMAGVQLAPTAEYLLQSQRAEAVDFDLALSYSLWPWKLATLLAPGLFGSPVQGDYWGYANYWEDALYVGLLPLLLALSFLLKPLARMTKPSKPESGPERQLPGFSRPPYKVWILVGIVLILIWGAGRFTPIFPWFYQHIPTFDLFQAPARVLIGLEFILALMAGLGAEKWRRPQGRSLYWTRLGTAAAVAVSLGAGIAWAVLGEVSPSMLRATAMAGVWGVFAGLLSLSAPLADPMLPSTGDTIRRRTNLWQLTVLVVISLDLLVAAWGLNPGVPLAFYSEYQASGLSDSQPSGSRVYLPASLANELKFDRFLRFDSYNPGESWSKMRELLLPNLGLLEGLDAVNNFDPFVPERYERWMIYLDELPKEELHQRLAWMNVGSVLTSNEQPPGIYAWQLVEGSQRVHWVPCAKSVASEPEAWQAVSQGGLDWDQWVIIENTQQAGQTVCSSTAGSLSASLEWIETDNPNHIKIKLDAYTDGWLVLADTWYPGWQARLDGEKSSLMRANYLFQAVYTPQGDHILELVYRPLSFWLGILISLLSLVFAGFLAWWGRQKNECP